MEQISYPKIEKSLMTYLISNRGELCDFTTIYNDFMDDDFSSIKDPNVLKQLKIRLGMVIKHLMANQNSVTVIKNDKINHEYKYMAGYMVTEESNEKIYNFAEIYNRTYQDIPTEKEIFNTIIDDNYLSLIPSNSINNNTVSELIFQGIKFEDFPRIQKIIQKYKISFYSANKYGIKPIDLIKSDNNNNNNFNYNLLLLILSEDNKELNIMKKNSDIQLIQINNIKNTLYYLKSLNLILFISVIVFYLLKFVKL